MRWFRFYSEVLHDPKVQQLPAETYRHWTNLLCLANETDPRGRLPKDIQATAFALRLSVDDTEGLIKDLITAHLIDRKAGRYVMHNWDNRQPVSDARATDGRRLADDSHSKVGGRWQNTRRDIAAKPRRNRGESGVTDSEEIRGDTEEKQSRADVARRGVVEFRPDAAIEHPEPQGATPFQDAYRKGYEEATKRPISGDRIIFAKSIEAEYGYAACVEVATAQGFDKHPKYYIGLLEELRNGIRIPTDNGSQRGNDNGRLAPDVYTAALYGTGRPPVFVLDPGRTREGEDGEHTAPLESRVVVS